MIYYSTESLHAHQTMPPFKLTLTLSKWITINKLTLNAAKCKYMVITRLRKNSIPLPPITLHGQLLDKVSHYKYLGITISSDLSWNSHIDGISSKARRIVGLIYRQFSIHSSPQTLLQLYVSLVRPHLEYTSQIWNPHLIKHIDQLEQIQKFALKVCWTNHNYLDLLHLSNLPCLADRRKFLNLCYFYKLVNDAIDFPHSPLTPRNLIYPNRQGRTSLFVQPYASSNSFLYSFFACTISHWNSLPQSIVSSPSLFSFKRLLYTHLIFS